jgi:hypothetical protein
MLLIRLHQLVSRVLVCPFRGHLWSRFGDEDEDGWFWDRPGDCYTRSCARCDHMQHRAPWRPEAHRR